MYKEIYIKGKERMEREGLTSPELKVPVKCLIDECRNIGKIPNLGEYLATCRKYRIAISPIFQNYSQIEAQAAAAKELDKMTLKETDETKSKERLAREMDKVKREIFWETHPDSTSFPNGGRKIYHERSAIGDMLSAIQNMAMRGLVLEEAGLYSYMGIQWVPEHKIYKKILNEY